MPLSVIKKEIETEKLIGYRYIQLLSRAEALVSGAGRDAVVPLLCDATAAIISTDIQNERLVLDGVLQCQAVYRQGEENTLRALSAKTAIAQAIEIPGAQAGMLCRADIQVEHIEAKYENGHMLFQVGLGVRAWVIMLEKTEVVSSLQDNEDVQVKYEDMEFVKLAAEADETAVMTASVELPHSLDARNTLMDWGCVLIDSVQPDLGGIRVKGRAMIETLVASGIEGRPAVVLKYPIEIDKLIELPEWLRENASVCAQLRNIRTQIDNDADGEEGKLQIQTDIHFSIAANVYESEKLPTDAYGTGNTAISVEREALTACCSVAANQSIETVRGTVITEEGSSAIGSIIAVRALPNIAEFSAEGERGRISGIIEADVLYMPAGGGLPSATHAELPFEMEVAHALKEDSLVNLNVVSAEANALMSDRLEMKIMLCAECETRNSCAHEIIKSIETEEVQKRIPGYIICWPDGADDAWTIGKRYGIAESAVMEATGDAGVSKGKCIVLNL